MDASYLKLAACSLFPANSQVSLWYCVISNCCLLLHVPPAVRVGCSQVTPFLGVSESSECSTDNGFHFRDILSSQETSEGLCMSQQCRDQADKEESSLEPAWGSGKEQSGNFPVSFFIRHGSLKKQNQQNVNIL